MFLKHEFPNAQEIIDAKKLALWKHLWVRESNMIDPQPGFQNIEGDPHWDSHMIALDYVLDLGAKGCLAYPLDVHHLLTMGLGYGPYQGKIRDCHVSVGGRQCPHPEELQNLLRDWRIAATWLVQNNDEQRRFRNMFGEDVDATYENELSNALWDMHCWFEEIHPFIDGNGRTGRLLLLNQCVITGCMGIDPLVRFDDRNKYYERISQFVETGRAGGITFRIDALKPRFTTIEVPSETRTDAAKRMGMEISDQDS